MYLFYEVSWGFLNIKGVKIFVVGFGGVVGFCFSILIGYRVLGSGEIGYLN